MENIILLPERGADRILFSFRVTEIPYNIIIQGGERRISLGSSFSNKLTSFSLVDALYLYYRGL